MMKKVSIENTRDEVTVILREQYCTLQFILFSFVLSLNVIVQNNNVVVSMAGSRALTLGNNPWKITFQSMIPEENNPL